MRLQRALNSELSAVANRGWQELRRSVDRLAAALPEERRPTALFPHMAARPLDALGLEAHAELGAFRQAAEERFFAGACHPYTPALIAERMPEWRERLTAAADAICDSSFRLLGHRALYLDEPIDWHRDVVSGRQAPLVHWSRIDPLDPESVGDSKVTWELNRHQWLLALGQAYRLSGDARYAEVFVERVRDWMRANPPGMGINWSSSLEVSYRMISWCWALHLCRDSAALTPRFFASMLGWLSAHASHVEKYLSHYYSPNTHLTGEALGLFYAGVLFPSLPHSARWRDLGGRILLEQLPRQVLPDGVYFEQSTCYQRYTADIYLQFFMLASRNGVTVPPEARERICLMLDHLLAVCRPDGSLPQFGDTDGGRLLPLVRRSAEDCRDVFALAAALFERPDYAWAARGAALEVVWLLGAAGCQAFDALEPVPPRRPPSRQFRQGGWAVMQGSWERDAHQLLFDMGPLGCGLSDGHGHADLLSIQCSVRGEAMLVDPGTYCYTAHANWRDHFRGTAAHNTVTVDRQSQVAPAGPFSWHGRPGVQPRQWVSDPLYDYADAEHDAYRRLPDPVRHRRRVLFVKPHYWVVVDDLTGHDVHQLDLQFQFAPLQLTALDENWVRAQGKGGALWVRPFAGVSLRRAIHSGEVDPIRGWISPDYGLRTPAPLLVYSTVERLPLRIVTLLVPREHGVMPPEVACVQTGDHMDLVLDGGRETVRVDGRQMSVERPGESGIGPLPEA